LMGGWVRAAAGSRLRLEATAGQGNALGTVKAKCLRN